MSQPHPESLRIATSAVVAACLTAILWGIGGLQSLEQPIQNGWFKVRQHSVESEIVLVGIDRKTLQELGSWPWRRGLHAEFLEIMDRAGAARVFYGVDFSAASTIEEDSALARAMQGLGADRLMLPVFEQPAETGSSTLSLTQPSPRFREHARLVSVNVKPGSDSLTREIDSVWQHGEQSFWSAAAAIAGRSTAMDGRILIDFTISPESFRSLSFSDVLQGVVSPDQLAGRTVLVGPTAIELGDMVPVPIHHALPTIVVQALGIETLNAGPLEPMSLIVFLLLLLILALCVAWVFHWATGYGRLLLVAGLPIITYTAFAYLYTTHRVLMDVSPFIAVIMLTFGFSSVLGWDAEKLRSVSYRFLANRREALITSIVNATSDSVLAMDGQGVIRTANPATRGILGREPGELIGTPIGEFLPALADSHALRKMANADEPQEVVGRASDGTAIDVEVTLDRVRMQQEIVYTAIVRDIRERKLQQARLEHQAVHDSLTGLPNRRFLFRELDRGLANWRSGARGALLMMDLDRFKEVNDTLGHTVGDEVLVRVARRLERALGDRGSIARLGGDEFAIWVPDNCGERTSREVARELLEALQQAIELRGVGIPITGSIGITLCPQHARNAEDLLKQADVAMYVAKRNGSRIEFYDRRKDQNSLRRLTMVGELRNALKNGELRLHYQPKIDLRSGGVVGVEALARWSHKVWGDVSPEDFVHLAEATDLIGPLTEWGLLQAAKQAAKWRATGLRIGIANNLSAQILHDDRLLGIFDRLEREHGDVLELLEIEITESSMMLHPQRSLNAVSRLRELGIRIAIDDFGTGHSSLSYLRDLSADVLKIDKSFVLGMADRENSRIIVSSTISMAHQLGIKVIAEGVETDWQESFLRDAGCDIAQGYLYSTPVTQSTLLDWMADRARPRFQAISA